MAQFLVIALKATIVVTKKLIRADGISPEIAIAAVQENNDLSLYDFSETDHFYLWKLKEDVLSAEIVPFLESVFSLYYKDEESSYKSLLGEIARKKDHDSLMKITKSGEYEHFELDNHQYGQLSLKKLGRHLRIDSNHIKLFKTERMRMDTFDKTMVFIENSMRKAFSAFQLSQALYIYIFDDKYVK